MSQEYDIAFIRGDTKKFTAQYVSGSFPINLTGAKIVLTYKASYKDADPGIFQISTQSGGIVITDPTNGEFAVTIASSLTANLEAPNLSGVYDCEVLLADGTRKTLLFGTFILSLNATRIL